MGLRRLRTWALRLFACAVSLFLAGVAGEAVLRLTGGYELFASRLVRKLPWVPEEPLAEEQRDAFLALVPPGIPAAWFRETPPEVERRAPDPVLTERWRKAAERIWVNYIVNEDMLKGIRNRPQAAAHLIQPPHPPSLFVAPGPGGQPVPAYRYLPSAVHPTGLSTNRFGFRGEDLDLVKPARTLRIACVGASTTVGGHDLPFSYPEYLQHWLRIAAKERRWGVEIQVVNAGREGMPPRDIEAIVKYEILPFRVDLVVYYECWNHLNPRTAVEIAPGPPIPPPDPRPPRHLERGRSAIVEQIQRLVADRTPLREVLHPVQTIPGIDPQSGALVDEARFAAATSFRDATHALDGISRLCAEEGIRFVLATYSLLAHEGLTLDPARHRGVHEYLNRDCWPLSYASLRRIMDVQNDLLRDWARRREVPLIDVAARVPPWPELYRDGVHATGAGLRVRGWAVLEGLIPLIEGELESGRLPRPDDRPAGAVHPHLPPHREIPVPEFR